MPKQCAICGKGSVMAVTLVKLRGKYNPTAKVRKHPNLQWVRLPSGVSHVGATPLYGADELRPAPNASKHFIRNKRVLNFARSLPTADKFCPLPSDGLFSLTKANQNFLTGHGITVVRTLGVGVAGVQFPLARLKN